MQWVKVEGLGLDMGTKLEVCGGMGSSDWYGVVCDGVMTMEEMHGGLGSADWYGVVWDGVMTMEEMHGGLGKLGRGLERGELPQLD